jgi:hypothetical protein
MQGIARALIRTVRNTPSAGAQTQPILSRMRGFRQSSECSRRGLENDPGKNFQSAAVERRKRLANQLRDFCAAFCFRNVWYRSLCRAIASFRQLSVP